MKKNVILTLVLALCAFIPALAGPAFPGKITYTQPDGSTIIIQLHGDEFCHWATDEAGNILQQDADGYWRIASNRISLETMKQKAAARRSEAAEVRRKAAGQSANFGSPKIPVILIGFKNKAFSKTNEQFDAMLNLHGYSDNNAVGSVWDYYNENSMGAFTPQFEVLGPVQLDTTMAYYGANNANGDDTAPEMALVHAARKLDAEVDFSRYDNDHDGYVDFVLFYFAGYDEAQGGGSNCIWSHAWNVTATASGRDSCTFDGVKLDSYFCTSELKNAYGSTMCSIGTTCHEFAHTLGLPDFYDTDYSTNGNAANMYDFDIMANGAYNSNSTTPPYFTAEELMEIGWMSAIPELATTGSYSLDAVNYPGATKYSAFMTKTAVQDEYFVYEVRGGSGWDAGIGYSGLMVYHVDKSSNKVSYYTASMLWEYNAVNMFSSHPCCYVVPAGAPTQTTLYNGSTWLFGGNKKTYTPKGWDGNALNLSFSNITYSNGTATFDFTNSNILGLNGTVKNSDYQILKGVTITVTEAGKSKLIMLTNNGRPAAKAASWSAVTGSDGKYKIDDLPPGTYQVTASLDGYESQTVSVDLTSVAETLDFVLLRTGEEAPAVLYPWPTDLITDDDIYVMGSDSRSITGQNYYPASEISKYAGKQIKEFTFYLYGTGYTTYNDVNIIIDYGNDRKATIPVSSSDIVQDGYTTVDLRDHMIILPSGKDVYAGVGFSRGGYSQGGYYYAFGACYKTDDYGNYYDWAVGWPYDGLVSEFNLTSTGTRESWNVLFDFTLTLGDFDAPETGYNYIADPGEGYYNSGDVFELTLVETTGSRKPGSSISWYYDGEPVSKKTVTLSSGTHTIEARFTTSEGKTKTVELEVNVN